MDLLAGSQGVRSNASPSPASMSWHTDWSPSSKIRCLQHWCSDGGEVDVHALEAWDAILRRQFWYWVLPLCLGDHDLFDGLVDLRDFMVGGALLGNPYLVQ